MFCSILKLQLPLYSAQKLAGLDPLAESFAAGDLPAGPYQISFWLGSLQQRVVEILLGKLTFVSFQIP